MHWADKNFDWHVCLLVLFAYFRPTAHNSIVIFHEGIGTVLIRKLKESRSKVNCDMEQCSKVAEFLYSIFETVRSMILLAVVAYGLSIATEIGDLE